ncbi:MAG: DUF6148 family protein [Veillonella caviae]|uniref:DUF6148 family protein n=1 Tax=Veillonella caviae TaxID=248316 RepID=UPI002A91D030|nr:DUF6148 family protein [Veillonella caviae]MDY5480879.1 DUF6148 family protein [Veillonella caviae]
MTTTRMLLKNRRLKLYVAAEEAILSGQSYTIGNRTLTRANLAEVTDMIEKLLADGATLDEYDTGTKGNHRSKRVVLRD